MFRAEPMPESIRVCDGCEPLGDPGSERYLEPMLTFVMGLDQLTVAKGQREGYPAIRPALKTRGDIDVPDGQGGLAREAGVLLPTLCPALRDIDLPPEAWGEIKAAGCPGPEQGRRQYLLFGKRATTCGLLKTLQAHDSNS